MAKVGRAVPSSLGGSEEIRSRDGEKRRGEVKEPLHRESNIDQDKPTKIRTRVSDAIVLGWGIGIGLFLCILALGFGVLISKGLIDISLSAIPSPTPIPRPSPTPTPVPTGITDIVMVRRQDGAFYIIFVLSDKFGHDIESKGLAHLVFRSSIPSDTYEINYHYGEYGFCSPTYGPDWLRNSTAARDHAVVAFLGPIYHYTHTEIASGSIVTIGLEYTLPNGTTLTRQEKIIW